MGKLFGGTMKKNLFACLLCLVCSISNANTIAKQELTTELEKALNRENLIPQVVRSYGLPKDKSDVLINSLSRMFKEPRYIEYLAEQLYQFGLVDKNLKNDKKASEKVYLISKAIQEDLYKQGLTKAPTKDLVMFMDYQIKISETLSPAACRAFNLGSINKDVAREVDKVIIKIYKNISLQELKNYQNHLFETRMRAIDEYQPRVHLTETEIEMASNAFQKSLFKELDRSSNPQRIAKTYQDMENATDIDVCEASIVMYRALSSGTGRARELKMRWFMNQFAK